MNIFLSKRGHILEFDVAFMLMHVVSLDLESTGAKGRDHTPQADFKPNLLWQSDHDLLHVAKLSQLIMTSMAMYSQ